MKFAAIIVVASAIVALTSAAVSHGKRQSGCPPTGLSLECTQAVAAFNLALGTSIVPGTSSPSSTSRLRRFLFDLLDLLVLVAIIT